MKSFLEVVKQKTDPGIYMCAKFCQASQEAIQGIQKALGMDNPVVAKKLHTTIVCSRKTVDIAPASGISEKANLIGIEKWDTTYVGLLQSDYLSDRFNAAMSMGATYDFDDYKPHVTLAYASSDIPDFENMKNKLTLPVSLIIVGESAESLDLDKDVKDITEDKRELYEQNEIDARSK